MHSSITSDDFSFFDDYKQLCEKQKSDLRKKHRNLLKVGIHIVSLVNIASFAILFVNYPLIPLLVSGKVKLFGKNSVSLWFSLALIVFVLSIVLLITLFYRDSKNVDPGLVSEYCKFADNTQEIILNLKGGFATQHRTVSDLLTRCSSLEDQCNRLESNYGQFSSEIKRTLQDLYMDYTGNVKEVKSRTSVLESKVDEILMRVGILTDKHEEFGKCLDEFLEDIDAILKDADIDLQIKVQILERIHRDHSAGATICSIKELTDELRQEIAEKIQKGGFFKHATINRMHNLSKKLTWFNEEANESNFDACVRKLKNATNDFVSTYAKRTRKDDISKNKQEVRSLSYIVCLIFFLDLKLSRFLVAKRSQEFISCCKDGKEVLLGNFSGNAYTNLVGEGPNPTAEDVLKDAIDLLDDIFDMRGAGVSIPATSSAAESSQNISCEASTSASSSIQLVDMSGISVVPIDLNLPVNDK